MTDLNELEAIVIANPAITINEVNANFGYNLEMDSYALMASKFTLDDMEWGPFLWGFLCCPVGLFVVVTNDRSTKDEKTSYWLGVGAGVVLNAIVSGIWAATVGFGSFGI